MKVSFVPQYDSDNSYPSRIIFEEFDSAIEISFSCPSRVFQISKKDFNKICKIFESDDEE